MQRQHRLHEQMHSELPAGQRQHGHVHVGGGAGTDVMQRIRQGLQGEGCGQKVQIKEGERVWAERWNLL